MNCDSLKLSRKRGGKGKQGLVPEWICSEALAAATCQVKFIYQAHFKTIHVNQSAVQTRAHSKITERQIQKQTHISISIHKSVNPSAVFLHTWVFMIILSNPYTVYLSVIVHCKCKSSYTGCVIWCLCLAECSVRKVSLSQSNPPTNQLKWELLKWSLLWRSDLYS